jgi:thiol-disulfide isomerase/thioredoxin
MKSILKYFLACLTVITGQQSFGQATGAIKPLNIGDTVPDIIIRKLIGSNQKSVRLSDLYKKGALIIDFWATWCSPCLEELSLGDAIAARHGNLSVLVVSHDDSLKVANFLKLRKDIAHANIIVTSDDKELSAYFRHRGIPHNVWIDQSGIVRLTTAGYAMNEKYVNQFLNGIIPKVRIKKPQAAFKFWEPYHVPDSLLQYRSLFTAYNDTLPGGAVYNSVLTSGKTNRVFIHNQSISSMYWIAYTRQLSSELNWKAVELHTKDSVKFFYPEKEQRFFKRSRYYSPEVPFDELVENWAVDNCYCYDLILPKPVADSLVSRYMIEDLNRFFNVKGKIESRTIEVSVMTKAKGFDSIKVKRFSPFPGYRFVAGRLFKPTNDTLFIQNRTLEQVIGYLVTHIEFDPASMPLVNETGIDYPVDMLLNFPADQRLTYDVVLRAFKENGLLIKKEKREVPILILYDLN